MLDTMALDDGMHELTVTVADRAQGPTTKTVALRVRNWGSLDDRLQAPIMAFGLEPERLQTEDKSDGWQYAGDDSQTFFDDVDRLTREIASREYLTWSAPALQECEVIVYARSLKVTGGVVLSVSADGTQWQDVS